MYNNFTVYQSNFKLRQSSYTIHFPSPFSAVPTIHVSSYRYTLSEQELSTSQPCLKLDSLHTLFQTFIHEKRNKITPTTT